MNPDQIVASLNRKNERLEEENKRLREEISTLASSYTEEIKDQAYAIYERDFNLQVFSKQMESSAEAIASLRKTLYHAERDNQLLNDKLKQETDRLQDEIARILQQSSESESQVQKHLVEISELKSKALMNTIHYNVSKRKDSLIKADLQSLADKSDALVKARDDLITRLHHKNRLGNKALQDAKLLNGQLSEKVQRAEQQILEYDRLKDSLRQDIANKGRLQEELYNASKQNTNLWRSLEYFRAENIKQQHTFSSIRQLENFRSGERAKRLQQTISHKTVEIE